MNEPKTVQEVRDHLTRIVDILDTISFNEDTPFKIFKKLQKVCKSTFELSYIAFLDRQGCLVQ